MIRLSRFQPADFNLFISWIDSEEVLITIAGRYFTWPLSAPQLQRYLNDPKSIAFNIVDDTQSLPIGHAEIIQVSNDLCKIDKLIIGNKLNRGKGIGGLVIGELLEFSFEQLHAREVELYVYDWNTAGIRCYEKAGFMFTGKIQTTAVNEGTWVAKHMVIDKDEWLKSASAKKR